MDNGRNNGSSEARVNTYMGFRPRQRCEYHMEADTVTCEDYNGNLWVFNGAEDWEVGDCASLLMDSKGTKKIRDDVVEGAKYSAWALGK